MSQIQQNALAQLLGLSADEAGAKEPETTLNLNLPLAPEPAETLPQFADYAIVGNSAAGIAAAEAIRKQDTEGTILMLSKEPYLAYGKPLISYLIEGKTDDAHLAYRDASFYERANITCAFGPECEVVALDADQHVLALANGVRVQYGKCLLAVGSTPFVPRSIKNWRNRENIHTFECLDDALAAWQDTVAATERAHAEGRKSRVIVVGGGLTGLKAAEALSHIADEAFVLTHGPRIMSKILDAQGSEQLIELLAERGVTVVTNTSVDEFLGEEGPCHEAKLTEGSTINFDVAIAAVGVRPAMGLAEQAGAEIGKGVVVDETLATTLADVYAAGDMTQVVNAFDGSKRPLALWTNAVRQGAIAGAQMAETPNAPVYGPDYAENIVDFFDISVMTCGVVNPPEGEGFQTIAYQGKDSYAMFVTKDDVLMGYVLVNHPERAGIYNALIAHHVNISELDPDMLGRAPRNLDFDAETRWNRLHESYPTALDRKGFAREVAALDAREEA